MKPLIIKIELENVEFVVLMTMMSFLYLFGLTKHAVNYLPLFANLLETQLILIYCRRRCKLLLSHICKRRNVIYLRKSLLKFCKIPAQCKNPL